MADEWSRMEWYVLEEPAACVRDGRPAETEVGVYGRDTGRCFVLAPLCMLCAKQFEAMGVDQMPEELN